MLADYHRVAKAVSDPTRVRILKLLEVSELCVCHIMAVLALPQSTTSQQLQVLRQAGLVTTRRDRRWIFYSLAADSQDPMVTAFLEFISGMLNHDATVETDRERVQQLSEVPLENLCAREAQELLPDRQ